MRGKRSASAARMSGPGVKDDSLVVSRIASLAIGGQVLGTVGGKAIPLTGGKDNVALGMTGDVNVREV